MRTPLRWVVDVAAGVAFVLVALLAGWWATDRARRWELPRWSSESFELLLAAPNDEPHGPRRWAVATNPRCGHCVATAWRLYDAREGEPWPAELVALIVDTPERPDVGTLLRLPPIPLWWDRENQWRKRWGHRLYGEVLEFDAAGLHVRTLDASEALQGVEPVDPEPSQAPVTVTEGGTIP